MSLLRVTGLFWSRTGLSLRQRLALLLDFVQEESFLREKPEKERQELQLSHPKGRPSFMGPMATHE